MTYFEPTGGDQPRPGRVPPGDPEEYFCEPCAQAYRASELKPLPGTRLSACPRCGRAIDRQLGAVARPYWQALLSSFGYPIRGSGIYASLGLVVFATFLSYLPFGGILAAVVVGSYALLVVQTSSTGATEPPWSQGAEELMDFVSAALRLALGCAVGFLPLLALLYFRGAEAMGAIEWVIGVSLGLVYMPAAVLVGAQSSTLFGGLNVGAAISIPMRIPVPYALTCAFLMLLAGIDAVMSLLFASTIAGIPLVGSLLMAAASIYLMLVGSHAIGVMAYEHETELN